VSNLPNRAQLQQVVGPVGEGARQVLITTSRIESNDLYVGVQDTGPGSNPETLAHLFEPFHTTKPNAAQAHVEMRGSASLLFQRNSSTFLVAGWDLHPLERAAFSRRTPEPGSQF
jgi:hypothetical protein